MFSVFPQQQWEQNLTGFWREKQSSVLVLGSGDLRDSAQVQSRLWKMHAQLPAKIMTYSRFPRCYQ